MGIKVQQIVNMNIHQQAYNIIAEQIISGSLKPGARITEKEIASILGVSRTPVREAMKLLSKDGLIEVIPHKGAIVRKLSLIDIKEIYEIRAVLEGLGAKLASNHIPKQELDKIIESVKTCKDELDKGRVEFFVEFDTKLHSLILTYCGNKHLQKTINSLNNLIYYFRVEIAKKIERSIEAFHEHNRILQALKNQDGDLAEEAMKDHILRTTERTLKDMDLSNEKEKK